MIPLHVVLTGAAALALSVVVGAVTAWWRERMALRSGQRAQRGRCVTVPALVAVEGVQRRGRLVADGSDLRILARGNHLVVPAEEYGAASVRRTHFDGDLFELANQRAFVNAAGVRYLVGPVDDWAPALDPLLAGSVKRASRWRLLRAAAPRAPMALAAIALLAFTLFQVVWTAGHDVEASLVQVVGEEGLETCRVQWVENGRVEHAGVDCYAPFPKPGDPVPVRALAWPWRGEAMDRADTYSMASLLLGGPAVLLAAVAMGVAARRLRTPPVHLRAQPGRQVTLARPGAGSGSVAAVIPDATLTPDAMVDPEAPLAELIAAVATQEDWEGDGLSPAPHQPWYAVCLMALGAGRWWPGVVLGGVAVLVEAVPLAWRWALAAGATVALGWAAARAVGAWLVIRRSQVGPVTSEWDYCLVRTVEDEWAVLLVLGSTPRWLTVLDGPGHPALSGRCGIRGDLVEGGAISLCLDDGTTWPTISPVARVDDELISELREDLVERLAPDAERH